MHLVGYMLTKGTVGVYWMRMLPEFCSRRRWQLLQKQRHSFLRKLNTRKRASFVPPVKRGIIGYQYLLTPFKVKNIFFEGRCTDLLPKINCGHTRGNMLSYRVFVRQHFIGWNGSQGAKRRFRGVTHHRGNAIFPEWWSR